MEVVEEVEEAELFLILKNQIFSNKSQEDMAEVAGFKVVVVGNLVYNVTIVKDLGILLQIVD